RRMRMDSESQIIRTEYSDLMKKSYIDYAMSVIIARALPDVRDGLKPVQRRTLRSEEHTSELQSRFDLVCRLLLEKKKRNRNILRLQDRNTEDNHETAHNQPNKQQKHGALI